MWCGVRLGGMLNGVRWGAGVISQIKWGSAHVGW